MTEFRAAAPRPEFSYQGLAADLPVMCGPGVHIAFRHANGLVHTIRLPCKPGSDDGEGFRSGQSLVSISPETECDIEPADPARVFNPVYQELVKHELPKALHPGLCMLLTGSCFQHHFSAVFSLYRDRAMPSSIVLDIDLADRCRAPIKKLAATYSVHHILGKPELFDVCPTAIAWRGGPLGAGMLELLAEPPAVLARPEPRQSSTSVRAEARIDPGTFTQRLHYRWRWTSCADLTR